MLCHVVTVILLSESRQQKLKSNIILLPDTYILSEHIDFNQ